MKNNLVPAGELLKVKEHLVGIMHLRLESSDDLAEYYGAQKIMRREIRTSKERERLIRVVAAYNRYYGL